MVCWLSNKYINRQKQINTRPSNFIHISTFMPIFFRWLNGNIFWTLVGSFEIVWFFHAFSSNLKKNYVICHDEANFFITHLMAQYSLFSIQIFPLNFFLSFDIAFSAMMIRNMFSAGMNRNEWELWINSDFNRSFGAVLLFCFWIYA